MGDDSNQGVYADPLIYDLESGRYDPAGSILLKLAAQTGGPILELGCGTGRVTVELARLGLDMTGLELAPAMLERARQKAAGLPITWINGDARDFQLGRRYGLIFTSGAVLQHLLQPADQEAMLARVRQHLAHDGRFVVDAMFKRPEKMVDVTRPVHWYSFDDDQGRRVEVSGTDHFDHANRLWTQTIYRQWQDGQADQPVRPVKLALRYFFPEELDSLLHDNGFRVLDRFGNWQGEPFTQESQMQIYVCRTRHPAPKPQPPAANP